MNGSWFEIDSGCTSIRGVLFPGCGPRTEFPIYSWWGGCPTSFEVRPTNFVLCHNNCWEILWFSGSKSAVSHLGHKAGETGGGGGPREAFPSGPH